jgi:DNA-binding MarR family transcriptional regulator
MHAFAPLPLPPAGSCTCWQVRRLARQLTALYDAALEPHELTVTQYSALVTLARLDAPCAVAALARHLDMDRTTTVRLVAPLEAAGLVARAALSGDRRARPLLLTAKGHRRLAAALPAWRKVQQQVDARLGARDADGLHEAAAKASRALGRAQLAAGAAA